MAEASVQNTRTSLSVGSDFLSHDGYDGSDFLYENICQPCSTEGKVAEAEKYCQDCKQHMCSQCIGFHDKFFKLKNHKLVDSADVNKDMNATFVTDIKLKPGFSAILSSSNITGLALVSADKLVAADNVNERILLIDTTKKIISEFKTDSCPLDVTVCGGEVVATHEVGKIVFLRCDDGLVYVRELRLNENCYGIDCVEDKLYVTYQWEKKLEVMTTNGTVLQTFQHDDQGNPLFKRPEYVTVSTVNQSIYVSDLNKRKLIVLSLDGKLKGKYRDGKGSWYMQLAVNKAGVMFVCDYTHNTIHLLSRLCEKVKILLTAQDGLDSPRSVCYCERTRRLYVGSHYSNVIKVYHIS